MSDQLSQQTFKCPLCFGRGKIYIGPGNKVFPDPEDWEPCSCQNTLKEVLASLPDVKRGRDRLLAVKWLREKLIEDGVEPSHALHVANRIIPMNKEENKNVNH